MSNWLVGMPLDSAFSLVGSITAETGEVGTAFVGVDVVDVREEFSANEVLYVIATSTGTPLRSPLT